MPFNLGYQKKWNPFLNCDSKNYKEKITKFHKNIGKISIIDSEIDFFSFIRGKRNQY